MLHEWNQIDATQNGGLTWFGRWSNSEVCEENIFVAGLEPMLSFSQHANTTLYWIWHEVPFQSWKDMQVHHANNSLSEPCAWSTTLLAAITAILHRKWMHWLRESLSITMKSRFLTQPPPSCLLEDPMLAHGQRCARHTAYIKNISDTHHVLPLASTLADLTAKV